MHRLFLRALGLCYIVAFWSLRVQVVGLIGVNGIIPGDITLKNARLAHPQSFWFETPSILHWWALHTPEFDTALITVCNIGVASGFAMLLGYTTAIPAAVCYLCYLSLIHCGSVFLSFQWDVLLCEIGFLALISSPWLYPTNEPPTPCYTWLLRLLLARFMLSCAVVKLNPTWTDYSAMMYHYLTTCLPSPLAYYAHAAPVWIHQLEVVATFLVEFLTPLGVMCGSSVVRQFAAWCMVVFQIILFATGNYGFLPLLVTALALACWEEQASAWSLIWPFWRRHSFYSEEEEEEEQRVSQRMRQRSKRVEEAEGLTGLIRMAWRPWDWMLCLLLFSMTLHPWLRLMSHQSLPEGTEAMMQWQKGFHLVHHYGLFAQMTHLRQEVSLDLGVQSQQDTTYTRGGSVKGAMTWLPVAWRYKPDSDRLDKAPSWVAPHMPRLDWQLWFAALSERPPSWLLSLAGRLAEKRPSAWGLLDEAVQPMPAAQIVEIRLRKVTVTYAEEKRGQSDWWQIAEDGGGEMEKASWNVVWQTASLHQALEAHHLWRSAGEGAIQW
mgnify:CR=1 FL=1